MEYPKIQTLFKRDKNNIIIPSEFTLPEFEYLAGNLWEATEKINGTNMRVELTFFPFDSSEDVIMEIKGRTSKAVIPEPLLEKMHALFDNVNWMEIFPSMLDIMAPYQVTIYGEGYGKKIQGCGSRYIKDDVSFILFDVKVGKLWLTREACEDISKKLHIDIVPFLGEYTLFQAINEVKDGFKSQISEDRTLDAEGMVLKPKTGLLRRNGERLITKIKTEDFRKFERRGGHEAVENKRISEGS